MMLTYILQAINVPVLPTVTRVLCPSMIAENQHQIILMENTSPTMQTKNIVTLIPLVLNVWIVSLQKSMLGIFILLVVSVNFFLLLFFYLGESIPEETGNCFFAFCFFLIGLRMYEARSNRAWLVLKM